MRVIRSFDGVVRAFREPVACELGAAAAIGFFDGVHLGHQHLLRTVVELARTHSLTSVTITFEDHPARLFTPECCPPWMTSVDEKIAALEALGLDCAIVVPFDWSLANRSAEEFVAEVLVGKLHMRSLVCGEDFALGKGRLGTVALLRELGASLEFDVRVVEPLLHDGEIVSSTRVRELIASGDVRGAAALLGRPYTLHGQVVSGRGLGRQLGVPTINLDVDPHKALPASGVYAVRAKFDGAIHAAALNIGCRPTVGGDTLAVEFHVIGTEVSSTPNDATLELVERLRDERKFASLQDLTAQIARDLAQAKSMLTLQ